MIFGALAAAYQIRFHSGWIPVTGPVPSRAVYLEASAWVAVFWFLVLATRGVYQDRIVSGVDRLLEVARGLGFAAILTLAAAFLYRGYSFSRMTVGLALLFTCVLLGLFHFLKLRLQQRMWRRGRGVRRCLLIGSGELATSFYHQVQVMDPRALTFVGVLAGDGAVPEGLPHLGPPSKALEVIRDQVIDQVVIALPSSAYFETLRLIDEISETSVSITLIPDLYSIITTSVHSSDLLGIPALNLTQLPIHGAGGQLKRAFDIVASAAALFVLAPVMLIIAHLVRRSSEGPILYVQERVGIDGRAFRMYKFRSMRVDAEVETGPIWARPNDPRCTQLGSFLRRYSLDELPQFWNVLKGDMSLVGPRPERPEFVEKFRSLVPKYMSRHRVRAGMTGWAQISGLRGQSSIEERTRYDIWYIENWSFLLDIRICLKTFRVVLFQPTGQ